jgi:crotonobetaine/carnitine-CoA ligase
MPEATARLWRNGWVHTGDAFRRDEHGNLYFVDRMKDVIRRRGENISSMEIEREILSHPSVQDCAAFAVPAEGAEDEVMVAIVPKPGEQIDLEAMTDYLVDRLAHFMVPRYFDVVDELPRTATQKVQKNVLASQGITPTTWDREAAGIILKRQRLSS